MKSHWFMFKKYFIKTPQGLNIPAQGNALGEKTTSPIKPCKGVTCNNRFYISPLQGSTFLHAFITQGVALGWYIKPFQGYFFSPIRILLFSLLFINFCSANEITPYSAEYSAQIKGISLGTATYRLRSLGKDQFEMRSEANLILSNQIEVSQFSWPKKNCQPQPSRYTYERNYLGKHKRYNIDFDTTQHKAHWIERNQESLFSLPMNTQDPLTEQLAARCQIKMGASLIQFDTVRKDTVAQHKFKRIREETINLPAGRYKTIRVEKQKPNSKKNYRTLLWFAPELDYLLVQLQHTEDNTTYTLQLKRFRSGE